MFEAKGAEAFALLSKQLEHKDARIAQAAALAILDRAYGKPAQQIEADFTHTKRWIGDDPPMSAEEWEANYGAAQSVVKQ
jgi:hypothetical protein